MNESRQGQQTRRGLITIIVLAVLTAIEFWVAFGIGVGIFLALAVMAVIKAVLIAEYFMHFTNLWHTEEE